MRKKASPSHRYVRIGQTNEVWAQTLKCASTTMHEALVGKQRAYTDLRPGDHVRLIVRDPRDRLVSAWKWFTKHHNCYIPSLDDYTILNSSTPFPEWTRVALRHWNEHWAPQTELHPRWKEFELVPITALPPGWGHSKKTREDNSWQQYYSDDLLDLVNEVYKEDIVMWKEATNGTDTGARRVLREP